MKTCIVVDGVSKRFKDTIVLNEVGLEVKEGTIVGIIGCNGSGKTMLMKIICGLVKPSSGTVWVQGKQIGKEIDFPENIGLIIETPGFINFQSGYTNLKNLAQMQGKITDKEIKDTMELVGLDPNNKKWVGKYSLGMRQRLGIAQAIMEQPDVILLDEPMNGLDKKGVALVREILLELKRSGKTILLASHNMEDIKILCDEVYEIDEGILSKCEEMGGEE